MKDIKSDQKKEKHTGEYWVNRAKEFGEKCVAIQQDPKLSADQKLEKQKAICNEVAKEIKADGVLKEEEKQSMIESIQEYMSGWSTIYDALHPKEEKSKNTSQKHTSSGTKEKQKK